MDLTDIHTLNVGNDSFEIGNTVIFHETDSIVGFGGSVVNRDEIFFSMQN